MTQIDGLVHSKTTLCSSKTVNFGLQNCRFTLSNSQNSKATISLLPSRPRNKWLAKGLKVAFSPCQDFRPRFNTSRPLFTFFLPPPQRTVLIVQKVRRNTFVRIHFYP